MADLKQLEETMNQQAASFTSEIPDDQFIAGAKAFYEAQAAYWEENSPEFYTNVFKPWYDSLVAPALGIRRRRRSPGDRRRVSVGDTGWRARKPK